jgi:hypothetical protein
MADDDMEFEMLMLEATDILADWEDRDRQALELVRQIEAGNLPRDIHDDAPLTLEQALFLPELHGVYTVNPEFREKSESVT